jgi:group I intron endonuclease
MIGIYKIISPKGRIYVGQSTNIKSRWLHYVSLDCTDQPKLYNSFLKYGVKNHKFKVLEEC